MNKIWQKEWGEITLSQSGFKEIINYFKITFDVDINMNSNIININKNISLNQNELILNWIAEGEHSVDNAHYDHINSSFWIWIHNEYKWRKNEVGSISLIEDELKEKPTLKNPEQVKMSVILFDKNKCEEIVFVTDHLHL